MTNSRRVGGLAGKSFVLDAGPLQTVFVLHYIDQLNIQAEAATSLIRQVRPAMAETASASMGNLLSYSKRRYYTQAALAEALRFRKHPVLKPQCEAIRRSALDAIKSESLTEIHVPADAYVQRHANLISIVGLTDALHVHLLDQGDDLVLITDDGRLRQHAGNAADRVILLDELLANDAGLN